MKKLSCFLFVFFPTVLLAQSVAISNDNSLPDVTALLDLKSSSKGLLIPRLTTLERTSIAAPAIGLTVFDKDTYSFWVYRGDIMGGWVELMHSLDKHWTRTGIHVFNTNNGNVGIGTNTPASKLTLDGTDPAIGWMNSGLATGYMQASGFDMKIGTAIDNPTGKMILGTQGNDHMFIDRFGRVSIGTNSDFDAEFKLNGTSPRFGFLHNNVQKGYLRLTGDDFKMGTYPGNSGRIVISPKGVDKIWVDEDGKMGIGTSTPSSVLTVNDVQPIIQLRNAGVDKGLIQIVNDDIKIGTNTGNTGKFIIRTNGADRLHVNDNGWVAIGTTLQNSTLQVNGDGTNAAFRVQVNGSSKMIVTPNGGVSIGANQFNPPDNGLYVAGMTAIATTTPTAEFTVNNLVANQHPRLEMRYNNTPVGQLETKQNAMLDVQLTCTNPTGRAIISANSNPFGVVVQPVTGQVSIGGTRKATSYNLCVNGEVICTELTINDDLDNWPDYVFEDNYKLLSLSEVKKFISANKHLPNIPSAAEIGKKGIEVGDMNKRLMEKIEELTLYVIQLQEQVDELKKKQTIQNRSN